LIECADVRADPAQRRAIQRAGTWWHVQPIGAGPGARSCWRLPDGVDRNEAKAYAVPLNHDGSPGGGQTAASANGVDLCAVESVERLAQRAVTVVADVIVGQGQQIKP